MVEKVYEVKILGAMADVVAPELFIWMMNEILRNNRKKVRVFVVPDSVDLIPLIHR